MNTHRNHPREPHTETSFDLRLPLTGTTGNHFGRSGTRFPPSIGGTGPAGPPRRGGEAPRDGAASEVVGGNTRPIWTGFGHFSNVDRLLLAELPLQAELRC